MSASSVPVSGGGTAAANDREDRYQQIDMTLTVNNTIAMDRIENLIPHLQF
jgi:hypothetical protein